jgi:hypothetical protein
MSFTLKESTNKYEKFHRQKQITMTFAEFNAEYGTCLPENEIVERTFIISLTKAKKSEGIPITRKLYSIYKGLTGTSQESIASPPPFRQIAQKVALPSILSSGTVGAGTIRPPSLALKQMSVEDPVEKYQKQLENEDAKFFDKKGLIVHLVGTDGVPLLGNTCKLNKSNGSALYARTGTLIMRNQSKIEMNELQINEEDHKLFMEMRKQKTKGPYFLRVVTM